MKKKTFLHEFLIIMMILLISGCSSDNGLSKEPTELISNGIEKNLSLKSNHKSIKLNINLDIPENFKNNQLKLQNIKYDNLGLDIDQFSNIENAKSYYKIKLLGIPGVTLNSNLFILSEKQAVFQFPMIPKPILIDQDDVAEMLNDKVSDTEKYNLGFMSGKFSDDQKNGIKTLLSLYKDVFKDENPEKAKEEIDFSSGKEELSIITYSYTGDDIYNVFGRMLKNIVKSEYFRPTLEQFKILYENDISVLYNDVDSLASLIEQFANNYLVNEEKLIEESKKNLLIRELSIKFGLDNEGYLRYTKIEFDFSAKNEAFENEMVDSRISYEEKIDKLNSVKPEEVKSIEIDENNSVELKNLFR